MTLQPRGYQFPSAVSVEKRDWDANWLIIDGSVAGEDGRAWSFGAPCLTTWEAAELSRWLRAVAAGSIAPTAPDCRSLTMAGDGPDGLLVFTEPTVAFSLAARDLDHVALRVHLASEARPPSRSPAEQTLGDYYVTVHSSSTELVAASEVWDSQLACYPAR